MKKFIAILLIFCTVISSFDCIVHANDIIHFDDKPKNGDERK